MLITFQSHAAADVLMYKTHAKVLLDILGKDVERGVITADEMPAAIAKLENEIAASKRGPATGEADGNQQDEDDIDAAKKVSFAARAYPLLEMMRAAQREKAFVMWGV